MPLLVRRVLANFVSYETFLMRRSEVGGDRIAKRRMIVFGSEHIVAAAIYDLSLFDSSSP